MRVGDRKANWLRMFPYSVKEKGSRFETISIFSLYFSAFILIVFVFIRQDYDWDIDHEIYYGQQLLFGNLLRTKEFHDKSPLVHIFCACGSFRKSNNKLEIDFFFFSNARQSLCHACFTRSVSAGWAH